VILFATNDVSTAGQVSGHDLSVLPEMPLSLPKGDRGLRSRAVTDREKISSLCRRLARRRQPERTQKIGAHGIYFPPFAKNAEEALGNRYNVIPELLVATRQCCMTESLPEQALALPVLLLKYWMR